MVSIIGEHGDSEFPVWSSVRIGPLTVDEYAKLEGVNLEELKEKFTSKVKMQKFSMKLLKAKDIQTMLQEQLYKIVEAILRDEKQY